MASTYEAATGITGVDTLMAGRALVTSAYLLHGDDGTLVPLADAFTLNDL